MKATSYESPEARPFGMVVIDIRDDIEADNGRQVMPGVSVHYKLLDDWDKIPVFVEIEVAAGPVEIERRERDDESLPLVRR